MNAQAERHKQPGFKQAALQRYVLAILSFGVMMLAHIVVRNQFVNQKHGDHAAKESQVGPRKPEGVNSIGQ